MTGNAAQVAAAVRGFGHSLPDVTVAALRRAEQTQTKIMRTAAPSRLRGVGRHGSTLNVRAAYTSGQWGPVLQVTAAGPWQLIEHDRRAGYPIPRADRSPRVLRWGAKSYAASVKGGAGRPRRPWARAIPSVVAQTPPLFVDELRRAKGAAFRG